MKPAEYNAIISVVNSYTFGFIFFQIAIFKPALTCRVAAAAEDDVFGELKHGTIKLIIAHLAPRQLLVSKALQSSPKKTRELRGTPVPWHPCCGAGLFSSLCDLPPKIQLLQYLA